MHPESLAATRRDVETAQESEDNPKSEGARRRALLGRGALLLLEASQADAGDDRRFLAGARLLRLAAELEREELGERGDWTMAFSPYREAV
jgi:hypothetical protein